MFAGVVEVQNAPAVVVGQISHAVPDPVGPIGDEHQPHLRVVTAAALHLHPYASKELVGVLDAADLGVGSTAGVLSFVVPAQCRDRRYLGISKLGLVSSVAFGIYVLPPLSRTFVASIDTTIVPVISRSVATLVLRSNCSSISNWRLAWSRWPNS